MRAPGATLRRASLAPTRNGNTQAVRRQAPAPARIDCPARIACPARIDCWARIDCPARIDCWARIDCTVRSHAALEQATHKLIRPRTSV